MCVSLSLYFAIISYKYIIMVKVNNLYMNFILNFMIFYMYIRFTPHKIKSFIFILFIIYTFMLYLSLLECTAHTIE